MILGAVTLALGWNPVRSILFQRGSAAVRHLEWTPDGSWWVTGTSGRRARMRLDPGTGGFGPWLLLVWRADPGGGDDVRHDRRHGSGRRYALIDATAVTPEVFRALRGRLKFQGSPEQCRPNR